MGSFTFCIIASTKLENLSNNGIAFEGTDSRISFEGPECVFQWNLLFIVGTVDSTFFEGSARYCATESLKDQPYIHGTIESPLKDQPNLVQ